MHRIGLILALLLAVSCAGVRGQKTGAVIGAVVECTLEKLIEAERAGGNEGAAQRLEAIRSGGAAADLSTPLHRFTDAGRLVEVSEEQLLARRTPERWWNKANSFATAWNQAFDSEPPLRAVVLGLAVAEHETWCGDAWPGEHNWGAVQKRMLNACERQALKEAGIVPGISASAAARKAIAEAIAGPRACPALDHEALHVDSSPVTGPYFAYYWAFADDVPGAARFIRVLAVQRESCRQDLVSEAATERDLAEHMYRTGYYQGFHDPRKPGGDAANIGDYATGLEAITPEIRAALVGWTPGGAYKPPAPDPRAFDLTKVLGQQQALNFLRVVSPALIEDGFRGPKTIAAIMAFQRGQQLIGDGIVGPKTIAALKAVLGAAGQT